MPPPRTEFPRSSRGAVRWLLPAALLALTPKCVLCVLAYAGVGTALGMNGAELCGASSDTASWLSTLAWIGLAGALGTGGFLATCRHVRRSSGRFKLADRRSPCPRLLLGQPESR